MTDKLYDGAVAFRKLEDIRYKFILGRKAQLTELYITFDLTHFHHLAGLHKLTDITIIKYQNKRNKAVCMNNIYNFAPIIII